MLLSDILHPSNMRDERPGSKLDGHSKSHPQPIVPSPVSTRFPTLSPLRALSFLQHMFLSIYKMIGHGHDPGIPRDLKFCRKTHPSWVCLLNQPPSSLAFGPDTDMCSRSVIIVGSTGDMKIGQQNGQNLQNSYEACWLSSPSHSPLFAKHGAFSSSM